jgi:hypothetical protein
VIVAWFGARSRYWRERAVVRTNGYWICEVFPHIIMSVSLFPLQVFHIVIYVSVRGVSVAINEIFVPTDTHLSNRWICSSAIERISHLFVGFVPVKTQE